MSLAFFIGALVLATLAVHPFLTYPLSLRLFPRKPLANGQKQGLRYSVCLAAYNEAAIIRQKAENLLAMRAALGNLQILIYVDGDGDATGEILAEYGDAIQVVASPERRGKSAGMNRLMAMADGDIVLFTDANVMVDAARISAIGGYFADETVGCVCCHLVYTDANISETATVGTGYWSFEEELKQRESDSGSAIGADGALFAIRRELYQPVPPDVIDDLYTSLRILCDGYRVVRAGDVVAYEKPSLHRHEEFRRKVRISCRVFNAHRTLWPRLRRLPPLDLYKYISHRFLRSLSGFNFLLAGLCGWLAVAALIGLWPALLAAAAGVALLALAVRLKVRPALLTLEVLSVFSAVSLGVVKSLQGERFQTWTPPASTRKL